ncbi:MAG: hypothetical protein Q9159_000793 [Coniocarpon cinnabarinum]
MSDPQHTVDTLRSLDGITADSFQDDPLARGKALAEARALVARLQTPFESMFHMCHEIPALNAALRVALDQGVFDTLEENNASPKTAQQLTRFGDPALLNRFLRHLAAMHTIEQIAPDLYTSTRHSKALRQPAISSAVNIFRDLHARAFISFPTFLNQTDYRNPDSASRGNWQYMQGSDESVFQFMAQNPETQKTFADFMSGYNSQRNSWVDLLPESAIFDNADEEGPLIVDIGGGIGHDLTKFLRKYPQSAGRLVVQDLPETFRDAHVATGIEAQAHSFFDPQPVIGARGKALTSFSCLILTAKRPRLTLLFKFISCTACFTIDDKCHAILSNLVPALRRNYSRLLLNELVIPAENVSPYATTADLTMAAFFSSRERTEGEWTAMLEAAGFRIVKIWFDPAGWEAVIEAELALLVHHSRSLCIALRTATTILGFDLESTENEDQLNPSAEVLKRSFSQHGLNFSSRVSRRHEFTFTDKHHSAHSPTSPMAPQKPTQTSPTPILPSSNKIAKPPKKSRGKAKNPEKQRSLFATPLPESIDPRTLAQFEAQEPITADMPPFLREYLGALDTAKERTMAFQKFTEHRWGVVRRVEAERLGRTSDVREEGNGDGEGTEEVVENVKKEGLVPCDGVDGGREWAGDNYEDAKFERLYTYDKEDVKD